MGRVRFNGMAILTGTVSPAPTTGLASVGPLPVTTTPLYFLVPDAGLDAGADDAGLPDAGSADAGTGDAGLPDGGAGPARDYAVGCSCFAADGGLGLLALAALMLVRRR